MNTGRGNSCGRFKNNSMQLPGLVQFRQCSLTDKQLAESVAAGLAKIYENGGKVPDRQIPAKPDKDFDLLVGEMVVRFLEKNDILKQIRHLDIEYKMEHGSFFLPQEIREKIQAMLS